MRVLIYGNAPWSSTGYGLQIKQLCAHLPALGCKVAVVCNYGLAGGRIQAGDVLFYPRGRDQHSNDVVQAHANHFKADVILSVYDLWPLNFFGRETPLVAWAPIDHDPLPKNVIDAIERTTLTYSYSQWGADVAQAANCEIGYIPLGVDTQMYSPGDKRDARAKLGLDQDRFIVVMVGANKSFPTRKNLPQALDAFQRFAERNPEADPLLYMHTETTGVGGGINVLDVAREVGLTQGKDLILPDQYDYLCGFPDGYMVDIYRAADVLLQPSMSEGFGIPIIEAQACGCPVIVSGFASMPELVAHNGLIIPMSDMERFWMPQGGWQVIPHVEAIAAHLDTALRTFGMAHVYAAVDKARQYDFETVVAPQVYAACKAGME